MDDYEDERELVGIGVTDCHEWNEEKESILRKIRNKSMQKAKELNCDFYFAVDCDNFLTPNTLRLLVFKDKPIVAPLLRTIPNSKDLYGNFFYDVTPNGYYVDYPDYHAILKREKKGTFAVPLVQKPYLIKTSCVDDLSHFDGGQEWDFILFARNARTKGIEQYICNEKDFGTSLHFEGECPLRDQKIIFSSLLLKNPRLENYFNEEERAPLPSNETAEQFIQKHYEKMAVESKETDQAYLAMIAVAKVQEERGLPLKQIVKSYQRACHYCPGKGGLIFT